MEANTTTPTLSQQEIQNIYNDAATQLINGRTNDEVIEMMTRNGFTTQEASTVVKTFRQQIAQAKLDKANKDIRNGALWCVGGLVVTGMTYSMASGGGSYLVCWGPVIFGGIQLFRGMANSGTANSELAAALAEE